MANLLFIKSNEDGSESEVEVPEQYVDDARRDPSLTEAAEFKRGESSIVVKKQHFSQAVKDGLKPVEDVSFLSALGRGAKSGVETAASAAGFGGKPLEELGTSADEEMAYAQNPVGYSIGKVTGILLPAVGGVRGVVAGARPIIRAAKPSSDTRQRLAAAKEGFQAEFRADDEIGPLQKVVKGIRGTTEAARSYRATAKTQKAVANFGGGGGPGGIDFINFIDPGEHPDTKYIAGRAETIAPGRYKPGQLNKLFSMGKEGRDAARQFDDLKEAEKFVPALQKMFDGLEEGKGATYRLLQKRASEQFWPAFADEGRKALELEKSRINRVPNAPPMIRVAIQEAEDIINKGLATDPRIPVTQDLPWSKSTNAEKYFRMDAARRVLDKYLDPQNPNPELARAGVTSSLQMMRDSIDSGLKKIPEKVLADQIYSVAKEAGDLFYNGMEAKKGDKIDAPKLSKLFDSAKDKGYRWGKAIDKMEYMLNEYGDLLVPEDKTQFTAIVNNARELQQRAESKKFVQGSLWEPGPTGPAVQRESALLQREQRGLRPLTARGAPADILESPAMAIASLDNFVDQASNTFYSGKKPSELTTKQKKAIVEMFTYRQNNPNSDIDSEKNVFKSIFDKWSK